MTTLTNKQQGSSHVILTVVLVVVIVGLLGFIFWQNFVKRMKQRTLITRVELQR